LNPTAEDMIEAAVVARVSLAIKKLTQEAADNRVPAFLVVAALQLSLEELTRHPNVSNEVRDRIDAATARMRAGIANARERAHGAGDTHL